MSYLGELDPAGWEQRVAEQKANYSPPAEDTPGFFAGSLSSAGSGLLRGGAKAADFLMTAFGKSPAMSDEQERINELADKMQEEQVESAKEFWTPDPRTVGTAGRVLGGFSEMVLPLAAGLGDPAVLVGTTTLAEGKAQVDAGVDAQTAGISAAFAGAGTYAGFKVPIVGSTLGERMAAGAIGNTVVNAGITAAERATLQSRGYEELAQNYDPTDLEARTVDILTGLAFGATHHLASPQQRAAAAAANNAKHYQADTAPGIPENATADAAHLRAMDTATEQVLTGEPVSVSEDVTQAAFRARPERTAAPIPEELVAFDEARAASVKSEPVPDAGGYDVAEGVLTDEQLKQFQGLRSDVQGGEDVRGSREGTPGQSGDTNDGGARGEPLRVYRGAARELGPEDFGEGALGHATGHPSSGLGVFFTNAADRAAQYGQVSEHHLDVRNPKVIPVDELPGFDSLVEAAAYRAKLMAEGHDGIVIDATHLGGPVDYVAFKPEQVLEAKKTATTSDARLADPQVRDAIEQLRGDIGLAERGGRLIRDAEGNASGRTSHIGSPLWMDRPGAAEGKGITAKSALSALDRVRDGKPLGAKQQEFVRYALDELDSVKGATEDFVNDAAREAGAEDPHVTAARELLGEHDVNIPTGGFDADGNPEMRSGRELLAEADAEVANAETMGQGIVAAVSCFLTRGV